MAVTEAHLHDAGLVGAPACGDVMKLQIKVGEDGKIQDAVFKVAFRAAARSHAARAHGQLGRAQVVVRCCPSGFVVGTFFFVRVSWCGMRRRLDAARPSQAARLPQNGAPTTPHPHTRSPSPLVPATPHPHTRNPSPPVRI